jgi:serine/threonine-protein kinase
VTAAPWVVAGAALLALVLLTVLLVVFDRRADDAVEGAAAAARRLVEIALPTELDEDRCTEGTPGKDELFVLTCPSADQPEGFPTTTFTVYPGDGAESALTDSVEGAGLSELDDVYACGSDPTPEGWARLVDYDGDEVGRVSCFVDADGDPQLHWFWSDLGMLGVAEIRGGGIEALANLRSWWTDYADRDLV